MSAKEVDKIVFKERLKKKFQEKYQDQSVEIKEI